MKKRHWLLLFLLVLGFVLRLYRLPDWLYFTMDEERDAFIVKRILVNHKLTLIGGSVPGGIYVGPGLYYLSVIPMFLFKLNPIGLGITASFLGVFSIWLIYKAGEKIFNYKVGLISAALFSTSFLMVIYNRHYWPLTPGPIVALITLFSLYQIIKNKRYKFSYLLAVILAVGLQSDPSNFTLLILTAVSWWFYRLPVKRKEVIFSSLILVFSNFPLVLFDLRHDFLNTRALIKLLSFKDSGGAVNLSGFNKILALFPSTFSRLIYVFGSHDISKQLAICSKYIELRSAYVPRSLFIVSSMILIFWLIKGFRKSMGKIGLTLIGFQLMITLLGIFLFGLLFPNHLHEYFLSPLFPSFFFLMALTIEKVFSKDQKFIKIAIVAALVFFNSRAVLTASNTLGLKNKMEGVKFTLRETKNEPFFLESLSSCFKYNGTRYLFYLEGKEPVKSFMDPYYTWLYDQEPWEKNPKTGVIFVSHDKNETNDFWEKYSQYQSKVFKKERFGDLEVLLIHDEQEK